jgi:hypothetical protein
MSESSVPATPGSADAAAPSSGAPDPLACDWSLGLPGPRRPHGIPEPKLLVLNGATPAAAAPDVAPAPPVSVDFAPPPDFAPSPEIAVAEPAAEPAADSPPPDSESAPTPWSDPVPAPSVPDAEWEAAVPSSPPPVSEVAPPPSEAAAPDAQWEAAVPSPAESLEQAEPAPPPEPVALPDTPWSDAAPAEPGQEWQPEAPAPDFEQVQAPQPVEVPTAPTDWSSLRTGPDWMASAPTTEAPAPEGDVWGAPPPAAAESEWSAAAPASAETEWPSPAAEPAQDWSAPTAPEWPAAAEAAPLAPPAPAAAWNSPAVGASALEQLESEPPEPEPGAAAELFGTVPTGGMLAGDDDEAGGGPDLASPEEESFAVTIDHEDPDLPEAVDEKAAGARPQGKPLAAFRPPAQTALEVRGEHRVAVHTRGGRTLRGSVRDVDLSKSQFTLMPQGGTGPETIYHSDVKAIFFMLAPNEKPRAGQGGKVRVTFADGRVIEGIRDGADAKHGFFLVPHDAARTNTRRIYIAREATSDIKDG